MVEQKDGLPQESRTVKLDHKEVAELIVKAKGIKEGIWCLGFEIGLKAGIVLHNGKTTPTVLNMITGVTLDRIPKENDFSVDAGRIASGIILVN